MNNNGLISKESRLYKVARNMGWNLVYEIVRIAFVFLLPKYIIELYSSEVNGLTSTVNMLVMLVSLVQAGIGTAATFYLYKPLQEKDKTAIASYIVSARLLYKKVALISLGVGFLASVLIAFLVNSTISPVIIFTASFIICINTAITLGFSSLYQIFIGATQNKHLSSKVLIITTFINYGLQALVIVFRAHYLWFYVITLSTGIVAVVLNRFAFKKIYREYEITGDEVKNAPRIKIKGMGYASINEISHSVVGTMMTLGVSILCGLTDNSVLSVYLTVNNTLLVVGNIIYTSFSPSFGSVVAEGNIDKLNNIFEIFQFVFFTVTTFLAMCAMYLILPFVKIYTSGATDANYVNYLLAVLLIIYNLFYSFRIPYNIAVSTSGLFEETYLQPIITATVAVLLILLLAPISFELVLVGPILFYVVNTFYQHVKLKKLIKGFENNHFWKHLCVALLSFLIALLVYNWIPIYPNSFLKWMGLAIITSISSMIVLVLLILIIDNKSFKNTISFFVNKVKK